MKVHEDQGAAESNQIFTGSIDGVDNILVKNFDCCFLRQILTTVILKIKKVNKHFKIIRWQFQNLMTCPNEMIKNLQTSL